ncbi:MAG: ABC transporter permease [Acetobacteraceae bacterium]|nr:ABC transporter permease [Acetobacteraceae bacterium]
MRIGVSALYANKMRSILTALGMVVGVAAVVCMMSVGLGAQSEGSEKIRTLGANLLLVRPGAQNSGGTRLEAGSAHTLTEDDAAAIRREIPEVQLAAPLLSRAMHVVAADRNWATTVAGITSDYLLGREWSLADGRSFRAEELEAGEKVAIVGRDIVEQLFEGRSGVGETLRIGNVPFSVIGVLDRKGQGAAGLSQDDVVFIPLSAAKSRVLGAVRGSMRDALDFIMIKVSDSRTTPEMSRQLTELLRQRHHLRGETPDDFRIQDPAEILTVRKSALRNLGLMLIAIASVSLIVGGISIMNIMLVSVTERTREIGLRIAVGARRSDIGLQFLTEAVTLSFAGGILGIIVGALAAALIALLAGWPVLVSPLGVIVAWLFATLIGISFGLYPAWRASRLDPIVALRCE